jgi:polyferredoxin
VRQTHIWSSVIISLIMLVFILYLIPNYTSPPDSALDLSPSFIPSLAVTVALLLSILLGVTAFLTKKE